MKLKNRILDIYRIQLLLAMIILILNDYLRHLDSPIILCLVGITLLLASFNQVSRPWQKLNWGIQLLVGPFILSHATGNLLVLLSASNVICGFVVLCYLVLFLPYAELFVKPLKNFWFRLFWVIFFFQIAISPAIYYGISTNHGNRWLTLLLTTGCLGAITYFITVTRVFAAWRLQTPLSLTTQQLKLNWAVVLTYCLLVVLFLYSNLASCQRLIWRNDLHQWQQLLLSLESGIGEETLCRYAILTLLLVLLRNTKWPLQLLLGIFGSSLIFGLFHFINLTDQSLSLTIYQFCFTTVSGIFFALIFLYTGQLWLVMLIHFVMDFAASLSNGATFGGTVSWADYQSVLVLAILMVGLTTWMMFGKRAQVMVQRVRILTNVVR